MTIEDDISALFMGAKDNVLIVAPFIRSEALSRLLDAVPSGVNALIVTRWRIADLLARASDLGVYELASAKEIPLYLRGDLHAKVFSADHNCLVGSANVTDAALGKREDGNLELLVPFSRVHERMVEFERNLLSGTDLATKGERDRLHRLLSRLREVDTPLLQVGEKSLQSLGVDWVPQVRNPEDLYSVYRRQPDLGQASLEIMREELVKLHLVDGLDEADFKTWVAAKIRRSAFIQQVAGRIADRGEVTEREMEELLAGVGIDLSAHRPREVLEVVERWLSYFFATQYETIQDSVKLIRATKL